MAKTRKQQLWVYDFCCCFLVERQSTTHTRQLNRMYNGRRVKRKFSREIMRELTTNARDKNKLLIPQQNSQAKLLRQKSNDQPLRGSNNDKCEGCRRADLLTLGRQLINYQQTSMPRASSGRVSKIVFFKFHSMVVKVNSSLIRYILGRYKVFA